MALRTSLAIVATLAGLAATAAAGGAALLWSGVYDVSATAQHLQPTYDLLRLAGDRSIRHHARDVAEPPLDDPALAARGALCYRDKCLVCHGGPGVAQGEIGRSMQPLPGPLIDASKTFRARELYWVVKKGIKMSGMPAWEYRLADADHWALVAFLQRLPALDAAQFRAATLARTAEACVSSPAPADIVADPARGRVALAQYACSACHLIPGVTGAQVHVGPPLAGIAGRGLIAGKLANTPKQMAAWIRAPQRIDPGNAMPDLGVGERDARDIAAYLGTLH